MTFCRISPNLRPKVTHFAVTKNWDVKMVDTPCYNKTAGPNGKKVKDNFTKTTQGFEDHRKNIPYFE